MKVEGAVALVTGANRGLGAATALTPSPSRSWPPSPTAALPDDLTTLYPALQAQWDTEMAER
jgi:hypothetical protein